MTSSDLPEHTVYQERDKGSKGGSERGREGGREGGSRREGGRKQALREGGRKAGRQGGGRGAGGGDVVHPDLVRVEELAAAVGVLRRRCSSLCRAAPVPRSTVSRNSLQARVPIRRQWT